MVLFKKQGSVSETVADSAAIDLEDGATKEKNIEDENISESSIYEMQL